MWLTFPSGYSSNSGFRECVRGRVTGRDKSSVRRDAFLDKLGRPDSEQYSNLLDDHVLSPATVTQSGSFFTTDGLPGLEARGWLSGLPFFVVAYAAPANAFRDPLKPATARPERG